MPKPGPHPWKIRPTIRLPIIHIGVNPRGWGSRPPDFGMGVVGVAGGRGEVSENTIACFAQKVC